MKYMGSKARIAKEILPIILKDRLHNQSYVEPFCGGLGTADKVDGLVICSDINKYLIALWKGVQSNTERPKVISKMYYDDVRTDYNTGGNKYSDFIKGWVGFMGSANGRFFDGGYSGCSNTKIGTVRNYIDEAIRNIEKQYNLVNNIFFQHGRYDEINIPEKSIIYCDIPYNETKQYSFSKDFNYNYFWDWCRKMHSIGHKIFISEYHAPSDFSCIWEKKVVSSLSANGLSGGSKSSTEKLFTLCSGVNKINSSLQQSLFTA